MSMVADVADRERLYVSRFRSADEHSARQLVNALQVVGLEPELIAPETSDDRWAVEATAELEPTADNLADLEGVMRTVARRSGTIFEGCQER